MFEITAIRTMIISEMTDIMLRMLDVIKKYRSILLSGMLINNDRHAHWIQCRRLRH